MGTLVWLVGSTDELVEDDVVVTTGPTVIDVVDVPKALVVLASDVVEVVEVSKVLVVPASDVVDVLDISGELVVLGSDVVEVVDVASLELLVDVVVLVVGDSVLVPADDVEDTGIVMDVVSVDVSGSGVVVVSENVRVHVSTVIDVTGDPIQLLIPSMKLATSAS